ncbi:tRNA uridine-5-carboxymethylaminomethyl(34) synthesis GTPase MnmE [Oscillospiraceae bacterium MB08-C2-2]|nr:tRNA uridine-5-carboxymethylaminomethyl(34) synthesis GTPase MnmE [Oscillospiraceae bacterium MB08-C2-2]
MENSTIAAISTPFGQGGIGIVRVSGPDAFQVAEAVFRPFGGKSAEEMEGYTAALGRVFDEQGDLDDCILTVFRAPRSYTGENVAELSCHGGSYNLQRVLRLCLEKGAAPAQPGEFTRRAFLNGKLDLTQAEAVMDVIAAQSDAALRGALSMRDGALTKAIQALCGELLEQASHLAAWADYPEEEIEEVETQALSVALSTTQKKIDRLLASFDKGKILREGISAVLAGKPNVGKSTLMNLLAGARRSIVTAIPGTTRDVVEETVRVGKVILRLADTAGLRSTNDPVEAVGVELARDRLEESGLILAVFDSSVPLEQEDLLLLEQCRSRPAVAVVNKSDLPSKLELEKVREAIPLTVMVSAATGTGAAALEQAIERAVGIAGLDAAAPMLFSERQRSCISKAREQLEQATEALAFGMTLDAISVCLDCALDSLLVLTGQKATEQVVEQVFARFCVGK